jgi:hypothetical protein
VREIACAEISTPRFSSPTVLTKILSRLQINRCIIQVGVLLNGSLQHRLFYETRYEPYSTCCGIASAKIYWVNCVDSPRWNNTSYKDIHYVGFI